jgi:hypothetical protein
MGSAAAAHVLPWHAGLAERLRDEPRLWAHNDWHVSNLLWRDGQISTVLDFGLASPTSALFDLATAIERNAVAWLELERGMEAVRIDIALALLDGYRQAAAVGGTRAPAGRPAADGSFRLRTVRSGVLRRRHRLDRQCRRGVAALHAGASGVVPQRAGTGTAAGAARGGVTRRTIGVRSFPCRGSEAWTRSLKDAGSQIRTICSEMVT